jgi:mono/diheme cytochrome c family protein
MAVHRMVRLHTVFVAVAVFAGLAAAVAALAVASGFYNVAATEQHTALVYRFLDYAMARSLKARVDKVEVPPLRGEQRLRSGAALYAAHCRQCHGAPGVAPDTLALGMLPAPVNLVATARQWQPKELYWLIRNGLKMTGMPAWEHQLSEAQMWDVVAFVETLPTLSPVAYAQLASTLPPPPPLQQTAGPATRPGDARAGRRALQQYLCATCHRIPGIVGATRDVGPPLAGIGTRTYIAGVLPNTRENMVRWLMDPKAIAPRSAMPDLGVTAQDAHDIAAFLATLDAAQ